MQKTWVGNVVYFCPMQKYTFDRRDTRLFSEQQNLFAYDQERLLQFIGRTFSMKNMEEQLREKSNEFSMDKRRLLVTELKKQYDKLPSVKKVNDNIEDLENDSSFTITTGHQLSIFTGPIFLIYKILHVIRLCEELEKEYKQYRFIPLFWMASEDHDLEEVRSVDVYGKTLFWETEQQGAVGRMNTTGMGALKDTLRSFFEGKEHEDLDHILSTYKGHTQSESFMRLIHELFGSYGLLCLDGDNRALKKSFIPIMKKELKEGFSHRKVEEVSRDLQGEGFKVQVKSRGVNLFYFNDIERNRIVRESEGFYLKGEGHVSQSATLELLEKYPERFSPNVILRPLYQEFILPNVCYVGGVGELSYWIQLKGVFDEARISYPLLHTRTSMLYIDETGARKMEKANIQLEELFLDKEALKFKKIKDQAKEELDFSAIDAMMKELEVHLAEKILSIDHGLEKYAESELVKLRKQIEGIKEKLRRSIKQRHDIQMNTIDQLFSKLFPNSVMQERVLNIFGMCPSGKIHERIRHLYSCINPLDPDLVVLID
jgi:bacillithiol biosynthesis cysteine-adding enzyme BshC